MVSQPETVFCFDAGVSNVFKFCQVLTKTLVCDLLCPKKQIFIRNIACSAYSTLARVV